MIKSMRRLLRLALDGIAAMSLLLALFIAAVWISRLIPQLIQIPFTLQPIESSERSLTINGENNILFCGQNRWGKTPDVGPAASDKAGVALFKQKYIAPVFRTTWIRIKTLYQPIFRVRSDGHMGMVGYLNAVGIPYGYVIALFLLLPMWRWLPSTVSLLRKKLLTPPGHCKNCGYDLRASPGRCPECGSVSLSASTAP